MGALVPGGSAGGWPAEAPDPYVAVEQAEAATTINNAINFMASIGITILRELRLRSRSTATAATCCDEHEHTANDWRISSWPVHHADYEQAPSVAGRGARCLWIASGATAVRYRIDASWRVHGGPR